MNYRAMIYYVGMVLKLEAVCMLLPLFVAVRCGEHAVSRAFMLVMAGALAVGITVDYLTPKNKPVTVNVRDGFVLVAICWVCISLVGALPFAVSGAVPSFVDCVFESISGFSTTGASILADVEALPKGLLLWRSLSHWVGGMGVLVFLIAIAPSWAGDSTVNVMRAESPGPAPGKLVPRLRQSSKILYTIYLVLTVLMVLLLLAGGLPLFDSVSTAMSTAGTGGFAVTDTSIAAYNSVYVETVITVFMILFGVNFNMFYFLLMGNFKGIWRSDEFKTYLGMIAASTVLITLNLFGAVYKSIGEAFRYAVFQVGSVITTTGFVTADFSHWPQFSRMILLLLMFVGACAGSTAGGLKVSRVIILIKEARRLLNRMAHPRSVGIIKLDGKVLDKQVVHSVNAYVITFLLILSASVLLVSLDNLDFETTTTAVIACISNVGLGEGLVSPAGNFSKLSALSKVVLSLDMLVGRLEIYPILLMFTPRMWRKI